MRHNNTHLSPHQSLLLLVCVVWAAPSGVVCEGCYSHDAGLYILVRAAVACHEGVYAVAWQGGCSLFYCCCDALRLCLCDTRHTGCAVHET